MLRASRFVGRYHYLLMASSLLLVGLLQLSWMPSFPVTAKLIPIPGLYVAKAPENSIVEAILINKKEPLKAKQNVICLRHLQALTQHTLQDADLKRLQHRLRRIDHFITRQAHVYKQYQLLANKKLLSTIELLQKKDELRHLLDEKAEVHAQIENLELSMHTKLQIPFPGSMEEQLVQEGQIVHAKQALMVFRPLKQSYVLKVKLPLIYQQYVHMQQTIKLHFIQHQRINTYPVTARVSAIYPRIISQDQAGIRHYFLMLHASVDKLPQRHQLTGIKNMPLEGYLIGPSKPIYQWIWDVFQ